MTTVNIGLKEHNLMNQTLLRVGIENLNQSGSVSYKEILATPISCPGTQFTKQ